MIIGLKQLAEMEKLELSLAEQLGSQITGREALLRGIERLGTVGILGLRSLVSIEECGEPLIEIPKTITRFAPHPFLKAGAPYGKYNPFYIRKSLLKALLIAREWLQKIDPELDLIIYDGFRPLPVQQYMICHRSLQECRNEGFDPTKLNYNQKQHIREVVYNAWAYVTPHPEHNIPVPPHSTGGCVDVDIIRKKGDVWEKLSMGSSFEKDPPEITTFYFHRKKELLNYQLHSCKDPTILNILTQEISSCQNIIQNRGLLQEAMRQAGFHNLIAEVWHFSLGDQIACVMEGLESGKFAAAKYGKVDYILEEEASPETIHLFRQFFPNGTIEGKNHQEVLNEMVYYINYD